MATASQRRAELQEGFADLEKRLTSKGVKVQWCYIEPDSEIQRLVHGNFLGTITSYLTAIKKELHKDFFNLKLKERIKTGRKFRKLLTDFMEDRKNLDYDLTVVLDDRGADFQNLEKNYLRVGKMDNPNYESQFQEYITKSQAFQKEVASGINKAKIILNSEEGKMLQQVSSQYEQQVCSLCQGAGCHGTGQSGIGDVSCEDCGGSGRTDHRAEVTDEQLKIAERAKSKLKSLGLEFGDVLPFNWEEEYRLLENIGGPDSPIVTLNAYVPVFGKIEERLAESLKTCAKKNRKNYAMKLAHTKTDRAIRELIQMADSDKPYISQSKTNPYGADDQLIAIEALAKTKSPKALDYLRKLSHYQISSEVSGVEQYSDGTTVGHHVSRKIEFPYAKGELHKIMCYQHMIITDIDEITPDHYSWDSDALANNKAYQRITSSIQRLEHSLQSSSPDSQNIKT